MLRYERPPLRLALLLTGVLVVLLAGPVGLASRTSVLVSPSTDRAAAVSLPERSWHSVLAPNLESRGFRLDQPKTGNGSGGRFAEVRWTCALGHCELLHT
jgi:hypothetical protein